MAADRAADVSVARSGGDAIGLVAYTVFTVLMLVTLYWLLGHLDEVVASPINGLLLMAGVGLWIFQSFRLLPQLATSLLNPVLAVASLWVVILLARRGLDWPTGLLILGLCLALGVWKGKSLFSSFGNTFVTLLSMGLMIGLLPPFIDWAFINAVWRPDPETCRAAAGVGACWGIIAEKWRLILFGTYPFDQQWRPAVMVMLLLVLIGVSMVPAFWRRGLALAWALGLLAMGVLMWGGVLGLPFVPTDQWGGLPLTLILSVNGIVFSFPIAILLALGRRSSLPVIRAVCTAFIELVRGVPLITVLFMASLMIPLFLPQGVDINKLLRAQVAVILFSAAYLAEVVRAGLQAIPKGQFEAADSLGLSFPQKMSFVILPQALRLVIPPMVNSFIAGFKDTSLVIIIGLFDLLGTTRLAANDPAWRPFYVEGLIFLALMYFVFCYTLARYSRYLEVYTRKGERR